MDWILELGIAITLFLQSLGTWMTGPMLFFSFLGTEPFFLLVAPIVFWCVDPGWGLRIGLALTLSTATNLIFKLVWLGPRPYWYDERVLALSTETSLGIPSGHSQTAVVVWGTLAVWAKRSWAWIGAFTVMFLIGLSRLYLGVHFLHDVLAGWLLGALILLLLVRGERALKPWLQRSHPAAVIAAALGLSLALIAAAAGLRAAAGDWTLPKDWTLLAARVVGADPIEPFQTPEMVTTAAAFFGMAAGGALLYSRGWYDARGSFLKLLLRYMIGLAGLLGLYIGLGMISPEGETLAAISFRYLQYALVGLWVTFLAPELFIRLRIAERSIK